MVLTVVPSTLTMDGGQVKPLGAMSGVGVAATKRALAKRDRVAMMKCIFA